MKKIIFLILFLSISLYAKKTLSMRPDTYEVITKSQELMDEKKYDKSKQILDNYIGKVKEIEFDKAYVNMIYGYLYLNQQKYHDAIKYFNKVYKANILAKSTNVQLLYNLSMLYSSTEQYSLCVKSLELWMNETNKITAEDYITYSNALIKLKQYKKAIVSIKKAIEISPKLSENYYQLLFYAQYEASMIDECITTSLSMIEKFKKNPSYWKQLASLYITKNNYKDALSVMEIIYREGWLEKQSEILNLYSLYRSANLPYKAAIVLEKHIKLGTVKKSEKNLKQLADSYYEAKEIDKALIVYKEVAKLSNRGEDYFIIAQIYSEIMDYENVVEFSTLSLNNKVKNSTEVHYVRAMALYNLRSFKKALKDFTEASKSNKLKKYSLQWISYIKKLT